MIKTIAMIMSVGLMAGVAKADLITVNFDTDGNWTAGAATITSYASDHTYTESGLSFTGGEALRQTTAAQDGFAGALGTYSWRLRNNTTVSWTATYTLALDPAEYVGSFGFSARRWDNSPSPAFLVDYSVDGGATWTVASGLGSSGTIDNAALGDSSDWSILSQTLTSPSGLAANQFVVRVSSSSTTERMMVDDFTLNVVPEPATMSMLLLGLVGARGLVHRRKRA